MANLRLVCWNVNGIRAWQRKGKLEWLLSESPDVFCIQETKAHPEQLDAELLEAGDYGVEFHSCSIKKGYSGVATYSKIAPKSTVREIGITKFDQEGRILQSEFEDFTLLNIYFPKGEVGSPRLPYKLAFYDAVFAHCTKLRKKGHKLVVCGDYNTAHREIDLARPKQNENTSGFLAEERVKIDEIIALGYVDVFRHFTSEAEHYSWWSMRSGARQRNVGWRIDYFFVTDDLLDNVVGAAIMPDVLGSDHCPISLELAF